MSSATGSHGHWTPAGPVNDEERIIINVGGVRHETYKRTLLSIPGSRLANLVSDTGAASKTDPHDFFFDRSAEAFSHILNYYRTGKLHYPPGVCGPLFEEELAYWGISANDVESCCWTDFRRHRDAEAELSRFEPDEPPAAQGHARGGCMPKAWALFDDPDSSVAAKVIGILSLLFIMISLCSTFGIASMALLDSSDYNSNENHSDTTGVEDGADELLEDGADHLLERESTPGARRYLISLIIDLLCIIWFSVELLVRIICCPNKKSFWTNGMNIIDVLAIVPFYLLLVPFILGFPFLSALVVIPVIVMLIARCLRLLRVFKMLWHYTCARALVHTLRASLCQFFLLAVPLIVAILIFSTLAFISEAHVDSQFGSILDAFWWVIITMTTVGYGDMYPVTWVGKVFGSLCALTGVLAMAMPIPILVYNFSKYYTLVEAKLRRPAGKGQQYNGVPLVAATAPGWSHS
ncbi:potassium voltage-gated channel subfamily C member 4-like [Engraulis encrasicolus]|uniref:potassium voltage-gated channel subfamily C member 4-like n=1 Tax=Engraulis encrasicolus TaxID=184585 RepID=UPI002FD40645